MEKNNLLDNIGVTVNIKQLVSKRAYMDARDVLYGKGCLSRIWMQFICPLLRPHEYLRRYEVYWAARTRLHLEFFNAVCDAADINIKDMERGSE